MSLFSTLSQNLFSTLFSRKKIEEISSVDDTISTNSIPSFSILNQSRDFKCDDYNQPSTVTKRENIFFGKDIDSNDTNEIIDYNLKKLRRNHDVIASQIKTSSEPLEEKSNDIKAKVTINKLTLNEFNNNHDTDTNNGIDNNRGNKKINDKEEKVNDSDDDSDDVDNDDGTETENEFESDIESGSESETEKDVDDDDDNDDSSDSERSTIFVHQNPSKASLQQQQNKKNLSKHSSIDDIILEDLNMDKLIYNVPPPMIKISTMDSKSMSMMNTLDIIPMKRCKDTMSVPPSMTKFRQQGKTYNANRNILSRSLGSPGSTSNIPGIRTIELRKPNPNDNHQPQAHSFGRKILSTIPVPSRYTSKELVSPLSSSLLALQNEQPSLASLISDESHSNETINNTDSSYYVYDDDDDDDDIFNYSMKEL